MELEDCRIGDWVRHRRGIGQILVIRENIGDILTGGVDIDGWVPNYIGETRSYHGMRMYDEAVEKGWLCWITSPRSCSLIRREVKGTCKDCISECKQDGLKECSLKEVRT